VDVSRVIIEEYNKRLLEHLENDVVIVGSGPAGLAAAFYLSKSGVKTVVVEKRLSIGGGIWGGAAGCNVIVTEDSEILDDIGVSSKRSGDLYAADSIEFAVGLAYSAKSAGAEIFNLTEAEDIILKKDVVEGVVLNDTNARMNGLPIDPFCISGKFVIDATGHPAELVNKLKLRKPKLIPQALQEGFMDVETSEEGVVDRFVRRIICRGWDLFSGGCSNPVKR